MKALLPFFCFVLTGFAATSPNRFTVLDESCDIYYPNANYPKLTTPQWIGEDGVDAALVLAIDDMRDPKRYEAFLRPILERLKQIDGRAPLSIMTCNVDPQDAQLQSWLKEGLSLEVHTIDHPCPILDKNDFAAAKSTYDRCVDLMYSVPGNHPVAFRTPCMDGINSASPRLFSEIMMRTAPSGRFLTISSSIGMVFTPDDPENPKELVTNSDGQPRFNKYLPSGWVNYIKDYPYPWVIGNSFWEAGFCVPDDYQASKPNGDKAPSSIEDMKASIDAVVAKKGLWVMTFHPYNWIANTQVVALIDHTIAKHGKRVKFLNFREVQERIDKNLLANQPLRRSDGGDNGVRLLDLNNDGYLDVVIGNDSLKRTRLWDAKARKWNESDFPAPLNTAGAHFGVLHTGGQPSVLLLTKKASGLWNFDGNGWKEVPNGTDGLEMNGEKILSSRAGHDNGVRLRDLDGDGISELIVSNPRDNAIFFWNEGTHSWKRLGYALPKGVSIVTEDGRDNGVRFVDFNKDGADDLIFSNEKEYGLWLYVPGDFLGFKKGFSREIVHGKRGDKPEIPMIVRGGEFPNNSAWFTSDTMYLQNEDTGKLTNLLERVSFKDLLDGLHAAAKSPQESHAQIEPLPGFQVNLVAHEPQVESPVYLDWSADGTMWVVEMRDYPRGINGKPAGVIKHLQDEDGDGFYEKSNIFLDNVNYPNGLFPWRKGILISAAPDILYAEDTDGDGRADKVEVLVTGFVEGNQQHRANGYEWGLDGWLYGANGDSGGEILSKKTGKRVSISGRDFRFKPDTGEFEAISGNAQYGRHRDDWGNWFGGANYTWGWHYYLEEQYLSRNPSLAVRGTRQQYATGPDAGRVYPISRVQQRFNDIGMAGHVTSACSFVPYRDNLFGSDFEHAIFISEPVHNMVHREILEPDGVSFSSHRAPNEENREFLASRDPWFRPTTVKTGPDGALYICDMYRLVIEHPEWIPDDVQKRMNLRAGEGMGRIYRVQPKGKILRKIPNLAGMKNDALVAALESPNGWTRDTAQRLLVERNATNALSDLELLLTSRNAKVHLQTLATIATLNGVTGTLLGAELQSRQPQIRAAAVRLSEPYLRENNPDFYDFATSLINKPADPDLRVRYQLALSLGAAGSQWSKLTATALATLAQSDWDNDAMVTAILSSSSQNPELVLKSVLEKRIESERLISGLLKTAVRVGKADALASVAADLLTSSSNEAPAWKLQAIGSLLNANSDIRSKLLRDPKWPEVAANARKLAVRIDSDEKTRIAAIQLLARTSETLNDDLTAMTALLAPGNSAPVQRAALACLEEIASPAIPQQLLQAWTQAEGGIRNSILAALLKRPEWAEALLSAIETQRLTTADLGATIRQELVSYRTDSVRQRAVKLLAGTDASRDAIVQEHIEKVRDLKGDAERGRTLFTTHCALCHKAGNLGTGAGPNLAMLYDRGPEQIITAILDPNRAVEDRYRNYVAELKNGDETSGLLVSETGNSVTIMAITGLEQTIMRSDLQSLTAQSRSLMPEGFEQFLKPQDLADLISFIQSSASKPKPFPGNHPEIVRADPNGILHLTAANSEIYGDTIIFESGHQNLGYWKTESDQAVWTFESPLGRTYEVWLDWACPNDRPNNQFAFQVGTQRCSGYVEGTGTWDDYQQKKIGEITIPAGTQRAIFRATKPVRGFLLDLHEVRLVPRDAQSARK